MTAAPTTPRIPQWSPRDQFLLTWFFGRGQTVFERSVFGGMLERAELFGSVHHPPIAMEPVYDSRTGETVIGRESALSARPTAEIRPEAGYVPDDGDLTLYGVVSSRVAKVERRDAVAALVLSLLFGDAAERWSGTSQGRLGSLYALTAKGRSWTADESRKPGAMVLTDDRRLETLCAVQATQPKPERAEILTVCKAQAELLELRARAVWHEVKE